jgi:hypothetical protein
MTRSDPSRVIASLARDQVNLDLKTVQYAATGRVAEVVARIAAVGAKHERPWTVVHETLEIEDWSVGGRGDLP